MRSLFDYFAYIFQLLLMHLLPFSHVFTNISGQFTNSYSTIFDYLFYLQVI